MHAERVGDPGEEADRDRVRERRRAERDERRPDRPEGDEEDQGDESDRRDLDVGKRVLDLPELRLARGDRPCHARDRIPLGAKPALVRLGKGELGAGPDVRAVVEVRDRGRPALPRGGREPSRVGNRKREGDAAQHRIPVPVDLNGLVESPPLGSAREASGVTLYDRDAREQRRPELADAPLLDLHRVRA